ncbi:MAG: diguanylate cyclase [Deltaproteobacteria bacterium]|nr:diguanylate cyclase [Deltaproteobacteria bacterium]
MSQRRDSNVDTPITIPSPPAGSEGHDNTSEIDIPVQARHSMEVAAAKRQPCLVILGGLDMGRVFPVTAQGVVIGRDESCGLALSDDAVSREHVEVSLAGPGRVTIRDLDSTNGSFVRGKRVHSADLADGEKLFLGRNTVLKLVLHDDLDLSYQRELFESSTRDGLTGAFNRRYFTEKISSDLSFGRRHDLPLSLLMLDIDHFKQVNDTHGHDVGDQVLKSFSQTVADSIRTEDVLARYGGEEFAIIAQGTDIEGGQALGERIRHNIGQNTIVPKLAKDAPISITVSTGVASLKPGCATDAAMMIAIADGNLYAAKNGGRNRVVASEVE